MGKSDIEEATKAAIQGTRQAEGEKASLLADPYEKQRQHEKSMQEAKHEHERALSDAKARADKRKAMMAVWDQPSILSKYT
tara:strand:- start:577 stop:819 length:243 start_codon:yes stop_codon:yes gene_type:complete